MPVLAADRVLAHALGIGLDVWAQRSIDFGLLLLHLVLGRHFGKLGRYVLDANVLEVAEEVFRVLLVVRGEEQVRTEPVLVALHILGLILDGLHVVEKLAGTRADPLGRQLWRSWDAE